ncbi:50S ribosomal protein L13 [Rubinisphaera italica]|uniref:Large ribosomal subunit protein uL13 n=1 Tax=Rubinisphaera italica TaxID=2527969 RepID=A0A5C5XLM0_9PLAN|nr:50S ribosomal protein L13 [Rubinisphaera italica]TWT63850.1 50S ribosomal protein L13 [Rubinisphaera italica]HBN78931.1 50S ribosomal protein L13 [Planctomycetaceae bacterium]|tara:strand:- start:170 stop:673 length:504 start_codon:yes stop_codon:yes gene_type:complete
MAVDIAQRTSVAKNETFEPQWYHVDGEGQIVGRFASALAMVLMGKHKASYTAHVNTGDFVVVTNVEKVRFSGAEMAHDTHPNFTTKMARKTYEHYTGYPSGRKITTGATMLEKHPEKILQEAVRRMLPKNKLAKSMLMRLKLHTGSEHPHQSQNPQPLPEHLLTRCK